MQCTGRKYKSTFTCITETLLYITLTFQMKEYQEHQHVIGKISGTDMCEPVYQFYMAKALTVASTCAFYIWLNFYNTQSNQTERGNNQCLKEIQYIIK